MSRITSLIILAVLVVVIGLLSYRVLSMFVLPMFLAGMSAVLLKPLHLWLTRKCGGHSRAAALLTTLIMLLGVLLPSLAIAAVAASETATLIRKLDRDELEHKFAALRNRFSLGPPPTAVMQALDQLQDTLDQLKGIPRLPHAIDAVAGDEIKNLFDQLNAANKVIETTLHLQSPEEQDKTPSAAATDNSQAASPQLVESWKSWKTEIAAVTAVRVDGDVWYTALDRSQNALQQFRTELLGGPIAAWFKQNVNLDPDELQGLLDRVKTTAGPLALGTTQFLLGFTLDIVLGLFILLLGVYYFLADGQDMVGSVMRLNPLDPAYTDQLMDDFGNLTRAVVLSMLAASLMQGVLAGMGFYFCGVHSVFLVSILTALCAMVPFVGSTIVWVPCVLWVWLAEERTVAAIVLAVYCTVIVGTADNIVKPLVLHGRSNLHPLLALLSVLGGVQALGPIGVFVGPMVVALLHTVLVLLRKELTSLEGKAIVRS